MKTWYTWTAACEMCVLFLYHFEMLCSCLELNGCCLLSRVYTSRWKIMHKVKTNAFKNRRNIPNDMKEKRWNIAPFVQISHSFFRINVHFYGFHHLCRFTGKCKVGFSRKVFFSYMIYICFDVACCIFRNLLPSAEQWVEQKKNERICANFNKMKNRALLRQQTVERKTKIKSTVASFCDELGTACNAACG